MRATTNIAIPLSLLIAALLPLLVLAAGPTAGPAHDTQTRALSGLQQTLYAQAVQSFRDRRYAAAYGGFARLGDAGHVPSAQLALVMYRNGPVLFGGHWSATQVQQQRWNALVVNGARSRIEFANDAQGE